MTYPASNVVPVNESPTTVDSWWDTTSADEVEGQDLIRDEALYELVGVPFMATRAIYRAGIQRKGSEWRDDYLSLELRVAPYMVLMAQIRRIQGRRKAMDVDPLTETQVMSIADAQLVVNDGSTGLYRQVTEYLAAKEYIQLDEEYPKAGEKGESRYDLPMSLATIPETVGTDIAEVRFAPDRTQVTLFEIQLRCSRGLRFSEYPSPVNPNETARTWYLA